MPGKKSKKLAMLLIVLVGVNLALSNNEAGAFGKKKAPTISWEALVKKGNEYMIRDRMPDARRLYNMALKQLEEEKCIDMRKAIVLHDLAETYRFDNNWHAARMNDVYSSAIYEKDIESGLLGAEYSHKKPIVIEPGSLKPACPVCHENWKVVPILYGTKTGYPGAVPADTDPAFTHKPGGEQYNNQRWYCKACHQSF